MSNNNTQNVKYDMFSEGQRNLIKLYDKQNLKVGSYLIKEKLGQGGQANVFKALNMKENFKIYAIKQFIRDVKNDAEKIAIVKSETDLMQKFNHPNILRAFEIMETPNNYYIILEYCKKGPLNHLLSNGPLPEHKAVFFLQHLVYGLYELRQKNILHRDIKLGNLLVTEDNILKISDFGFSIHAEEATEYAGTRSHMAPEILFFGSDRGKIKYNYKADLWSTGVVFFELLHKRCPFEGYEIVDIKENIIRYSEKNLKFDAHISVEARDLLSGLLTIDKERRYGWKELVEHALFKKYRDQRKSTKSQEEISVNFENILNPIYQKSKNSISHDPISQPLPVDDDFTNKTLLILDGLKEMKHLYFHELNKLKFMIYVVQQGVLYIETFNYMESYFLILNISNSIIGLIQIYKERLITSLVNKDNSLEIYIEFYNLIIDELKGINEQIINPKFEELISIFRTFENIVNSYQKVISKLGDDRKTALVDMKTKAGKPMNENQIFTFIKNRMHELMYYLKKPEIKKSKNACSSLKKLLFLVNEVLGINRNFPYFQKGESWNKFDWKTYRKKIEFIPEKELDYFVRESEKLNNSKM